MLKWSLVGDSTNLEVSIKKGLPNLTLGICTGIALLILKHRRAAFGGIWACLPDQLLDSKSNTENDNRKLIQFNRRTLIMVDDLSDSLG